MSGPNWPLGYVPSPAEWNAALDLVISGYLPLTGGTLTGQLTRSGSQAWDNYTTSPAIREAMTYTGSLTSASGYPTSNANIVPFNLFVQNESITLLPGSNPTIKLGQATVITTTGGAGDVGAGWFVHQFNPSAYADQAGGTFFVALTAWENANANMTGATSGAGGKGNFFAFNPAITLSDGVFVDGANAVEIDMFASASATAKYFQGLKFSNFATTGFTPTYSSYINLNNASGAQGLQYGLVFGDPQGDPPLLTTGTAIYAHNAQTLSRAIDFSNATITNDLLKGPNGFRIEGTNYVHSDRIIPVGGNTFAFMSSVNLGPAAVIASTTNAPVSYPVFQGVAAGPVLWDIGGTATTITIGGTNATGVRLGKTAGTVGFYGTTPVALQTGVAVSAAGIWVALNNLGLITA